MSFVTLSPTATMSLLTLMLQVDGRLPMKGTGSPINTVAAVSVPNFYTDTNTGYLYFCTITDGTADGTNWAQITLSVEPATNSVAGIVELATSEEVLAGTNNTLAITPFAAAGAFGNAGENTNITSFTSLEPLPVTQGGTGVGSISALLAEILPSTTGNAGLGLSVNGSGVLVWTDFRSDTVQIVSSSSNPLLLDTFHLVTAEITSTVPTPTRVGNKIILACESGAVNSQLTSETGELFNGQTGPLILDDPGIVSMEYTGSTAGWWVTNV
jgi:hypothetical protein